MGENRSQISDLQTDGSSSSKFSKGTSPPIIFCTDSQADECLTAALRVIQLCLILHADRIKATDALMQCSAVATFSSFGIRFLTAVE